jgi:hypothetical protein
MERALIKFKEVIFLKENQSNEFFDILEKKGEEAALAFLTQWDHGDQGEVVEKMAIGRNDYTFGNKNYIMGYNLLLEYVYLYAIV